MRQLLSRLLRSSTRYAEISEGNKLIHDLVEVRLMKDAAIDIVLIRELTENVDVAWRGEDQSSCWPAQLPATLDQARVMSFSYSYEDLKSLGDLIDPKKLRECAMALLGYYPLNPEADASDNPDNPDTRSNNTTIDILKPVIFIAHGFGGLIYEKALTMSFQSKSKPKRWRKHAVLLLDTPHHGAGMADWAIICAKRLGIPCASTPQKQKWTLLAPQLKQIETMQREFRAVIREKIEIDIYGCFAMKPMPGNHLFIAPEWSVLPDFHVVEVEQSHFGMTRIKQGSTDFITYCTILSEQVKKLLVREPTIKTAPLDTPAPEGIPTTPEETPAPEEIPASIEMPAPEEMPVPAQVTKSPSLRPTSGTTPRKLSLLISSPFKALRGPLNDVASIEALLKGLGFSVSQCYDQNATRAKILAAWDKLIDSILSSDDTVMIYYSGYGGIIEESEDTELGEQRQPRYYQYLVPMDFEERRTEDHYNNSNKPFLGILDIEIANLLYRTAKRTPNVTIIFDCSYSGHLTRASNHPKTAIARNLPKLYHDQLSSYISSLGSARGDPAESQSQLKSNEHVVFIDAATRGETAWDELFDEKHMGALTNALVSVLEAIYRDNNRCGVSWQMAMQRVRELVNLDFPRQSPRVVGPAKRILFSTKETNAILLQIDKIDEATNIGDIKAGRSSGLRQHNIYTLMPPGEESVNETRQLGTARIVEVTAFHSKVKLSLTDVSHASLLEEVLGFLTKEGPVKWPISIPDDDPSLRREIFAKYRHVRPTDPGINERFLASINYNDDTMTLHTMQGVQIAHQQVSGNISESTARQRIISQAEQLAISHQIQTLICYNQDEKLDHYLDITIRTNNDDESSEVIKQDGQGSILENSKISVLLNSKSDSELYIYVYYINSAGELEWVSDVYHFGHIPLPKQGSYSLELPVRWTEYVSHEDPITMHLFFLITEDRFTRYHWHRSMIITRLGRRFPFNRYPFPFDFLMDADREMEQDGLRNGSYNTRLISFQIEPRKPSISNLEP